ncbi:D-arabinono-1,4-lactone oxidase-domain-containing protein [Gautieria morchelliformis]|nr:D-arabinono-1,4-lactone oxidase-domain-containing protein [Gautieria morchelliformis]
MPFQTASTEDLYHALRSVAVPPTSDRATFTNWGGVFRCQPLAVFEPDTEEQCRMIIELARREGKTVRAAAAGHSPSDLACTNGFMIRTTNFNRLLEITQVDEAKRIVTVQGGMTLNTLHKHLSRHNLALENVGSISEQSIAGVVATATHGSGVTFGSMSTQVVSLTLLLSDGSQVRCSRQQDVSLFLATLCGLGTTGFITTVQIACQPAFHLREVATNVPFNEFVSHLHEIATSAEHVRCWWFSQRGLVRVSRCDRTSDPPAAATSWFRGVFLAYHVVQLMLFIGRYWPLVNYWTACFASWIMKEEAVGVGESYNIFNVDCRYPQYTTEWAVPFETAPECLLKLREWIEGEHADPQGLRPHFPFEIRFSEADDIWLSPGYKRRTCWIGIAQYKPYGFVVPHRKMFSRYEAIVGRHGGRPHWAKEHALGVEELRTHYERLDDFLGVVRRVDPVGMFTNEYVRRHLLDDKTASPEAFKFKTIW